MWSTGDCEGEAKQHYAKICTVSIVGRRASAAVVYAAVTASVSLVRSISSSGLIMCDSGMRKQVKWKEGREGSLQYRDGPSPPPDITDESIDAASCTFSADPARRGKGGCGVEIFGQLPMAWQLEFEFSSLCHYYILRPHASFISHKRICACTSTHTHKHRRLPLKCICCLWSYGIRLSARYEGCGGKSRWWMISVVLSKQCLIKEERRTDAEENRWCKENKTPINICTSNKSYH